MKAKKLDGIAEKEASARRKYHSALTAREQRTVVIGSGDGAAACRIGIANAYNVASYEGFV